MDLVAYLGSEGDLSLENRAIDVRQRGQELQDRDEIRDEMLG